MSVSVPGDRWEREAEKGAAAVVAPGGGGPIPVVQRAATGGAAPGGGFHAPGSVAGRIAARQGRGRPLSDGVRALMESRLGSDLGDVRVHTGGEAAGLSRSLSAHAFTVGRDIFFGARRFAPETVPGRRLLAHELIHTMQQQRDRTGPGWIQRDGSGAEPAIGADTIFPFARDRQIQVDQILPDSLFGILRSVDRATASTLEVLRGQRATVRESSPDRVVIRLNQSPVTLSATSYAEVQVSLERQADGTFTFSVSGETGSPAARSDIFTQSGLSATRRGGAIVLSTGSGTTAVPQLEVAPLSGGGVDLRVLRESFIDQVPETFRGLVPAKIDVLRLSELPPASQGDAVIERAAREATARASASRTTPRQEVRLGGGLQAGAHPRALLQASWQYNFQPIRAAAGLFQVPLQVSLQYAPSTSVIGRVTSGVGTSLSALRVPLNLRVMIGAAGGQVLGPEVAGVRPDVPVGGLTFGGGAGLELGRWRINLDYDYLVNLVPGSSVSGVHTVLLGGGVAF